MVDERTLRRPTFSGGVRIRFGDGQFWFVPLPVGVEDLANRAGGAESLRAASRLRFGAGYLELLRAIREAEDRDESLRMELALAIRLLRSNYSLDPSRFESLLSFGSHEDLVRMQQAMTDVASAHLRAAFPVPDPAEGVLDRGRGNRVLPSRSFSGPLSQVSRRVLMSATNALSRFST